MKKPKLIDVMSEVGLTALDSDSQILRKTSKVAIRKMEEYYDPLLTEALEALRWCNTAIGVMPVDSLGRDEKDGHYYADELLSSIKSIIKKIKESER